MAAYAAAEPDIRRMVKLRLLSDIRLAQAHIGCEQAAGETYEDACGLTLAFEGLGLSPLFRFGLAVSIEGDRFRRLAKCFEERALLQYHVRNRSSPY
jgi:hypothetical protein